MLQSRWFTWFILGILPAFAPKKNKQLIDRTPQICSGGRISGGKFGRMVDVQPLTVGKPRITGIRFGGPIPHFQPWGLCAESPFAVDCGELLYSLLGVRGNGPFRWGWFAYIWKDFGHCFFFLVFLTLWSWYYSIIIIIFFVFCCDFSLTINHHHLSWLGFRFPFSTFQTQHESAYVITWVVSSFSRLRFWQPCSWPTRQRGQEEVRIRLDLSWNPCCFEYPKIIKNHKGLFERGRILIILYSISLEIKVHKSMRNHNRLHFILDLSQLCQSWF